MPTLQQRRWEAFADKFDDARRQQSLKAFGYEQEYVDVRVDLHDGVSVQMRLLRVDLDGRELIGRDSWGAGVCLPLDRVQAVWHHKRRTGRILAGICAAASTIGAVVGVMTWGAAGGAYLGAMFGGLLGVLAWGAVIFIFDKSERLYEWILMYDETQPFG